MALLYAASVLPKEVEGVLKLGCNTPAVLTEGVARVLACRARTRWRVQRQPTSGHSVDSAGIWGEHVVLSPRWGEPANLENSRRILCSKIMLEPPLSLVLTHHRQPDRDDQFYRDPAM